MKIKDLCEKLNADVHATGDPERDVTKAAAGDLLSFIIGTVSEGSAWITIQAHLNVAAVAVLKDIPVIILASGRKAPPDLIERCRTENICVASVSESIFGTCKRLSDLGING
ncbi:MAG TPA: serine kinase [Synergistaceae bacterium]|nr:serine kinase [Synergistaceae bacterium]